MTTLIQILQNEFTQISCWKMQFRGRCLPDKKSTVFGILIALDSHRIKPPKVSKEVSHPSPRPCVTFRPDRLRIIGVIHEKPISDDLIRWFLWHPDWECDAIWWVRLTKQLKANNLYRQRCYMSQILIRINVKNRVYINLQVFWLTHRKQQKLELWI